MITQLKNQNGSLLKSKNFFEQYVLSYQRRIMTPQRSRRHQQVKVQLFFEDLRFIRAIFLILTILRELHYFQKSGVRILFLLVLKRTWKFLYLKMKKYSIISNKKRNELIERVVKNGQSVSRVSKQLRMKLPSAKSIIRTFKKSGKIFDKKKVISRKLNGKRVELSDTDHQSELSSQSYEKRQEKVVKEEMQQRVQSNINQIKQGYSVAQSAFVPYQKMEDFGQEYYSQLLLNQQIAYYYNILTYFQNQSF